MMSAAMSSVSSQITLILLYASIFVTVVIASDTVTPTNPLSGDRTLVSSDGNFALGFFSPPNSDSRYVTSNGTNGNSLWSTPSSALTNPVAKLLDNGNLVVKEAAARDDGGFAWQSFDHPTDTLMAGMELGTDFRTGATRNLASWRAADDPVVGEYTIAFDVRRRSSSTVYFFNSEREREDNVIFRERVDNVVALLKEIVTETGGTFCAVSTVTERKLGPRFLSHLVLSLYGTESCDP